MSMFRRPDMFATVQSVLQRKLLGTPDGPYELVGNTEYAWLLPTADLERHVDFTKPDFRLETESGFHRAGTRR